MRWAALAMAAALLLFGTVDLWAWWWWDSWLQVRGFTYALAHFAAAVAWLFTWHLQGVIDGLRDALRMKEALL